MVEKVTMVIDMVEGKFVCCDWKLWSPKWDADDAHHKFKYLFADQSLTHMFTPAIQMH